MSTAVIWIKVLRHEISSCSSSGGGIVVITSGFAREVADQLVFMDRGVAMEAGPPGDVMSNLQQPRTQAFLASIL
jgi:polar amino acid transport system ATP-binding protein